MLLLGSISFVVVCLKSDVVNSLGQGPMHANSVYLGLFRWDCNDNTWQLAPEMHQIY